MSRHIWTEEEKDRIKEIYKFYDKKELAELFNTSEKSIEYILTKLDLIDHREQIPEGHKKCPICKQILSIYEFDKKRASDPDDTPKRQCYCKICSKQIKCMDLINKKEKQEKQRKEKLIKKYIEKNKDQIFYCKFCKENHTIDDYFVYIDNRKPNSVIKICKKNRIEKNKKSLEQRKINRFNNM